MSKAKFITFEGIDGCGKSTQARMLLNRLVEYGKSTVLVREPGGTDVSESIRHILLHKKNDELVDRTEALLMSASRAQLTSEAILPNLERGIWVIADRYADSTLAYQGGGRNLDIEWLINLNNFATYNLIPQVTFFVDILPEEGFRRRGKTEDRIEREGLGFQVSVRNTYLYLVERFPERIVVLDGHQSVEEIHKNIWNEINRRHFIT